MPNEVYACTWGDAHGSTGDLEAREVDHKPFVYTTVGLLVKSDEVGVSIAHDKAEDGRFRDVTFIPRAMVLPDGEVHLGKLKSKTRNKRKLKEVQLELPPI